MILGTLLDAVLEHGKLRHLSHSLKFSLVFPTHGLSQVSLNTLNRYRVGHDDVFLSDSLNWPYIEPSHDNSTFQDFTSANMLLHFALQFTMIFRSTLTSLHMPGQHDGAAMTDGKLCRILVSFRDAWDSPQQNTQSMLTI